jgi:hypothetical protein
MKKILQLIFLSAFLVFIGGCDKDFVEINTNPFAINSIDAGLLFAGAQRVPRGGWNSEGTILQQFVVPFNLGTTVAFNFDEDIDGYQLDSWNQYTGAVKAFTQILNLLKGTTTQVNLQSITRIWKAEVFMNIVDTYGNVPYFKTGLAAIEGETAFFPAYDDDAAIYDDLYIEIKDALSKLDPAGDYTAADLFYGSKAYVPVNNAATQVAQWKKLGNSLLLRLGMRYTKLNPTKAASIVTEAFNGGVMASNADNALVVYDGTLFTNLSNSDLINNNPRYYYTAEPFVNQLKSTSDPRSKYLVASFADPSAPLGDPNPNTNVATQFGVPIGILSDNLTVANGYRGSKGGGLNYSQMNVNVAASLMTPTFYMTYAQTSLLLADAAKRGWIPGGDVTAKQYYEAGIKADMDAYALIITRTNKPTNPAVPILAPVSVTDYNTYIAQPAVLYNPATALNQINTQYWIANILNSAEGWANYRRTGFPVLARNTFNDKLLANGGNGYVHRFSYPDAELPKNKVNYQAAVANLVGGVDDLVNRVFWDIP